MLSILSYSRATLILLFLFGSVRSLITDKIHYRPGLDFKQKSYQFVSDHTDTTVLHNFKEPKGDKRFTLSAVEDRGIYALQVRNANGSFFDNVKIYQAVPSWLCHFKEDEYLKTPIPTQFYRGRSAVLPCTILGAPTPVFSWEKYDSEGEVWRDISGLLLDDGRYIVSTLGHLYIKSFDQPDTGKYRCRADNGCARCVNETVCVPEDVVGEERVVSLKEDDTPMMEYYFLNTIIENCWDVDGGYYDGAGSRLCTPIKISQERFYSITQYSSLNSNTSMEAFFDYQRLQNDDDDMDRVGAVKWKEIRMDNFHPLEDVTGSSGICTANITGFLKKNMLEYYYCTAYAAHTKLIQQSIRFEYILKEAPMVSFPKGAAGQSMARIIEVAYGQRTSIRFQVGPRYNTDIGTDYFNQFNRFQPIRFRHNSRNLPRDWHITCDFDPLKSDIVTITIDYAVLGDAGYYQVVAGNDEGWAIGPSILLIVNGTVPVKGRYVLEVLAKQANMISVQWNLVNKWIFGANYTVYYHNMEWDEGIKTLVVRDNNWAELNNLHPGVQYAVSVKLEGGLVADEKCIWTDSTQTEAEIDFHCSASSTNIKCMWLQPSVKKRRGKEYSYNVSISRTKFAKDTNYTRVRGVTSPNQQVTLPNLLPDTKYRITVVACNEVGCSDSHETRLFTTLEQIPGEVVFLEEPRPDLFSVFVSMKFPNIMPGKLETEVVRYEETEFKKLDKLSDPKGNDSDSGDVNRKHLFDTESFAIVDLKQSTTYYMRFRWKTGAGAGPFTQYYKLKLGRFIDYGLIAITVGVTSFFIILAVGFCVYVKRRWPGLVKVVITKVREHMKPSSYMQPPDDFDHFQHQEEDLNIVYEFDEPGEVYYLNTVKVSNFKDGADEIPQKDATFVTFDRL